jgi:thiamine-monophosphate kinase
VAKKSSSSPFARKTADSVAALGEEKLIVAIRRWLGDASPRAPFGIGDDCAVLPAASGPQLITVDPVIYGRHFDATIPPRAVGAKLLKRNLSDLAAMGGRPTAAVLALTLDPRTRLGWLEAFYRGLATCARHYGVPIVGGDIAQADGVLAASLTLLGRATGPRVVTRTGARRGDALYVTGNLGRSLPSGHHFKFSPRLAEGAWLARQPAVRAMMDVSDGLAKDLHALTPSGAVPALDAATLPLRRGADLRAALTDGEDYELVFALAARADTNAFAAAWRRAFPRTRLTRIGYFTRRGALPPSALRLDAFSGYEHLR